MQVIMDSQQTFIRVKQDPFESALEKCSFSAIAPAKPNAVTGAGYASWKEIAAYVTKTICPGCLFSVIDGKSKSVKDFLYGMPLEIE
jgi:hypothetical protein